MISKKSRKVVAALLIGATICASGTFAYFNAKTDLGNITNADADSTKTLNITNGKVVISAKIAGVAAGDTAALWAYDVARVSTAEAFKKDANYFTTMNNTFGLGLAGNDGDVNSLISSLKEGTYSEKNSSPDILGLEDDVNVSALYKTMTDAKTAFDAAPTNTTLEDAYNAAKTKYEDAKNALRTGNDGRAVIGTGVKQAIVNARPGDAFVLGGEGKDKSTITDGNVGVTIQNDSNLTTKIGIRLKADKNGKYDETIKQINAMNANGWKVYIKVTNPLSKPDANAGIAPFADWKELTADSFTDDGNLDKTYTCAVTTVKPGEGAPTLQMRVELPLQTVNYYQDRQTGNGVAGLDTEFDIKDLFEIVATQENNPGWNEDGSTTVPVTVSDTSTAPATDKINSRP